MTYYDWKQRFASRLALVGGVFVAGMIVEAVAGYSVWGIALLTFTVVLACVGFVVACDPLLERLYARSGRERGVEWADF